MRNDNDNLLFKKLTNSELTRTVEWAQANYAPGERVDPLWHPAVRVECERMNLDVVQSQDMVVEDYVPIRNEHRQCFGD